MPDHYDKKKKKNNPVLGAAKKLLLNKKNKAPAAQAVQGINKRNAAIQKAFNDAFN